MPNPSQEHLLLVDDDPTFLDLLRSHVNAFGFPYETAESGEEALSKLNLHSFDLVISDLMMPGMSGLGLLKEVRRRFPHTGVIIVTGYGDEQTYTDVIRAGATDFLSKPFFRDELEAKISRALREQQVVRELSHLVKNLEQRLAEKEATLEQVQAELQKTAEKVRELQSKAILSTYGPHRLR